MYGLTLAPIGSILRISMSTFPGILWDDGFFWQLKGFELIKAVHLDPVPFDMERDLITPTFKKKRPQLLKYYQVKAVKLSGFHFCFKNNYAS